MWKRIKAHLEFYSLAWQEFKRGKGYPPARVVHRLSKVIIFTVFGVGILTVVGVIYPLLSPPLWIAVGLGVALIVEASVVHFLGLFHKRRISELAISRRNVEDLARTSGMCYAIYTEVDEGRISLTEGTLRRLDAEINKTLNRCFSGRKEIIGDYYSDIVQRIPSDKHEYSRWLEAHMSKLSMLIKAEEKAYSCLEGNTKEGLSKLI